MKKPEPPLPLKWIKKMETLFPGCWNLCDYVLNGKGKDLPSWGDLCVMPIAGTIAIVNDKVNNGIPINKMAQNAYAKIGNYPALMAGLYTWRLHKEIYHFNTDFRELLYEQSADIKVPIELFFRLPYPAVWVDMEDKNNSEQGALVWLEYDINRGEYELRIDLLTKDDMYPLILHLTPGLTISESISLAHQEARTQAQKIYNTSVEIPPDILLLQKDFDTALAAKVIQLIMYICVDNAEIKENVEQKKITRRTDKPKDVYREIRKWDVGYRYGAAIRKYKYASANQSSGEHHEGSKKRPHTRCGHIHHFWAGSEKDNSKKLIAKWVAPMFINAEDLDDIIPTIHNIN